MPRKPKRKKETEIEKRAKDFAEEIEAIGKRFHKRMERKHKQWEREWEGWWFRTLGFIGPLIRSIFGIIFLVFGIWLLNWINIPMGSNFISRLTNFIFTNLHWFFAFFVFSNYTEYFSKRYKKSYWIISPLTTSIGIVIVLWICVWLLNIINASVGSSVIASVSNFLYSNLAGILFLFLILGYAFVIIRILIMRPLVVNMKKSKKVKRLYRSGKDKILGGVCGGIAEYFNVDPTIIRVLWVLWFLAFGSGILAYIIAWIIIPRNPKHKWK